MLEAVRIQAWIPRRNYQMICQQQLILELARCPGGSQEAVKEKSGLIHFLDVSALDVLLTSPPLLPRWAARTAGLQELGWVPRLLTGEDSF